MLFLYIFSGTTTSNQIVQIITKMKARELMNEKMEDERVHILIH